MNRARLGRNYYGYLFITPFILGFLIFGLYPVYNTISLSFTNATLMSSKVAFVGLKNFERLFADNFFMTAVGNTWLLWILNFIPQIGIAMLLAVWFTNVRLKIKAVGVWRALFFLPNLMMPVAVASLFFSLFSYFGPVNQLMVQSHLSPAAVDFLQSDVVARSLVIFIQWWTWFGQTVIIIMAGMTAIPVQLYEAAMVDGASAAQMFRRITLPLLKPILVYVFVTSLVGGMQMFDIPYLLTNGRGAPSNSILTGGILMYMKFSSSQGSIGSAAAVAVSIFIMTSVCSLTIFYFLRERNSK